MTTSVEQTGAAPAQARPKPPMGTLFGLDKRFLAPILITCILLIGDLAYGVLESYWNTGIAIVSSIVMEMVLGRLVTGRWPHLASAYITGISVGIIIRSTQLWPYILCSALAITSKYALRYGGRHLWNPSNLGVSVLLFLAPDAVATLSQQWGNEIWVPLIVIGLGVMILYSLGRLHITLTYALAFAALSFLRSAIRGGHWVSEISLLTDPSYQLFMFFMITDPKTTTLTKKRQCAVALLVALVETTFRLGREIHAPYYALFIVAPVTNFIEIVWDARRKKLPPAPT
jgi:Na+-transporting NADH:ubiquinone oxidoreductase subunit NqrB